MKEQKKNNEKHKNQTQKHKQRHQWHKLRTIVLGQASHNLPSLPYLRGQATT